MDIDLLSPNDDFLYQQLDEGLLLLKGELREVGHQQAAELLDILGQSLPLDGPLLLPFRLLDFLLQRGNPLFELSPALGQLGQGDCFLLVGIDEPLDLFLGALLATHQFPDQTLQMIAGAPAGLLPKGMLFKDRPGRFQQFAHGLPDQGLQTVGPDMADGAFGGMTYAQGVFQAPVAEVIEDWCPSITRSRTDTAATGPRGGTMTDESLALLTVSG